MTEYRYKELTEDELRRLEPGAEIWVRNYAGSPWQGPATFLEAKHLESAMGCPIFPVVVKGVRDSRYMCAAIREPVEPEQVITMDREYVTDDAGREVVLYCTDAGGPYPVHGCVKGDIEPRAWQSNGEAPGFRPGNLVPKPDWREQIPWSALADWVKWVAIDDGGDSWAFDCEPELDDHCWVTWSGRSEPLHAVRMPEGPKDWREAIAQRPEGK